MSGLGTLSWREMEAIACARLRLLHAREDVDEARRFATALVSVCQRRGIAPNLDALSSRTRWPWSPPAATERLPPATCGVPVPLRGDGLRETSRQGRSVKPRTAGELPGNGGSGTGDQGDGHHPAAASAKASAGGSGTPELSAREAQILERLEHRSDNEIAVALGLSHAGVRYHIHKIFAKLGARSRLDAVHRARRRGLLPAA